MRTCFERSQALFYLLCTRRSWIKDIPSPHAQALLDEIKARKVRVLCLLTYYGWRVRTHYTSNFECVRMTSTFCSSICFETHCSSRWRCHFCKRFVTISTLRWQSHQHVLLINFQVQSKLEYIPIIWRLTQFFLTTLIRVQKMYLFASGSS